MTRTIVLDASPLGMLCHPNPRGESLACQLWATSLELNGDRIVVPEIADYEVRRELLRARRWRAIAMLNRAASRFAFLPLDTPQMLVAAQLWARARQAGLPTASPESLDADVIVAAQAMCLNDPQAVVATSNPTHLSRFVLAEEWRNIPTS